MSTHAATSDCCSTCCASWPGKRRPDGPLFQPLSRLRERPAVQAPLPPAGEGGAQRRVRARLLTGIPKTTQGNVRRKKIGRASCRERVCQYVYTSVVAV